MRLCIVTDIFDQPDPGCCISALMPDDTACEVLGLAALCARPDLAGETLHQHLFSQGGMDAVVSALRAHLAPDVVGLGYSAGGTALWRAVRLGAPMRALYCVSSTRLRDEAAIAIPNHVMFGALDANAPGADWLEHVPGGYSLFDGCDHSFYTKPESPAVKRIARMIAQQCRPAAGAHPHHLGGAMP